MKTSELTEEGLAYAVAIAEGARNHIRIVDGKVFIKDCDTLIPCAFSSDWSQGGPIIEREKIECLHEAGVWYVDSPWGHFIGPTPLIAAMRCYVASKLGDEVKIPEEVK